MIFDRGEDGDRSTLSLFGRMVAHTADKARSGRTQDAAYEVGLRLRVGLAVLGESLCEFSLQCDIVRRDPWGGAEPIAERELVCALGKRASVVIVAGSRPCTRWSQSNSWASSL